MSPNEISTLVGSIGLPYAYYEFPEGTNQAPPYVAYYLPQSNDLYADNTNLVKIRTLVIELYTREKDFTLEQRAEDTINNAGLTFSRSEDYFDSDGLTRVSYTMQIIMEEDNE